MGRELPSHSPPYLSSCLLPSSGMGKGWKEGGAGKIRWRTKKGKGGKERREGGREGVEKEREGGREVHNLYIGIIIAVL